MLFLKGDVVPTVRMAEKLRVSEFHMLEVDVTYSDEEVKLLADEAGIGQGDVVGPQRVALSRSVELVLYEERKILVAAAVRSGLLDLLAAWQPKAV